MRVNFDPILKPYPALLFALFNAFFSTVGKDSLLYLSIWTSVIVLSLTAIIVLFDIVLSLCFPVYNHIDFIKIIIFYVGYQILCYWILAYAFSGVLNLLLKIFI